MFDLATDYLQTDISTVLLLLTKFPQQGHNLISQKDQLLLYYILYHLSCPSPLNHFLRKNSKQWQRVLGKLYLTTSEFWRLLSAKIWYLSAYSIVFIARAIEEERSGGTEGSFLISPVKTLR